MRLFDERGDVIMDKNKIVEIINNSKVLNKISDDRVFGFKGYYESELDVKYLFDEKDNIFLVERCDSYFSTTLNKDEMSELSKVFKEIADQM